MTGVPPSNAGSTRRSIRSLSKKRNIPPPSNRADTPPLDHFINWIKSVSFSELSASLVRKLFSAQENAASPARNSLGVNFLYCNRQCERLTFPDARLGAIGQ